MAAICTRVVLLKQNLGLGPRGALFKNMSEGPGKPFTVQHTELPPVALCYQGADLKPLFTVLSNSFPRLSTFSLDLSLRGVDIPEGPLPPLPSVTRLALSVSLNFPGYYGYILEPHRVFPALRELTIGRFNCSYENVSLHRSLDRGFSRQHIDSLLKCYPLSVRWQISLKKDNGMKYKRFRGGHAIWWSKQTMQQKAERTAGAMLLLEKGPHFRRRSTGDATPLALTGRCIHS
ncbi:hypothetical protein TYRP_011446 [Tyrophagus putrescentiae]|nr:hypothetical protein TYRP_011446 [Tyrophagus putrescentiae]